MVREHQSIETLDASAPSTGGSERRRTRDRLILLFKLTVATALVTLLIRSDQLDLRQFGRIENVPLALLALAAVLGAFLVSTIRWQGILRSLAVPVTAGEPLRISWLGLLGSQFLPGVTGGDLLRGAAIARQVPERRGLAILSVIVDRGIGLVGLLWIATIALVLAPPELRSDPVVGTVTRSIAGLGLIGTVGLILLCWERTWRLPIVRQLVDSEAERGAVVRRLIAALQLFRGRGKVVTIALGWSLIAHGLTIVAAATIARANWGVTASILDFALLVPVGQLAAALPITPGGVGVGEFVYETLFATLGVSQGAELSLWLRVLHATTALGAIPLALAHTLRQRGRVAARA